MAVASVPWKIKVSVIASSLACSAVILLLLCVQPKPHDPLAIAATAPIASFTQEPIQPISVPLNLDPGKVQLGRELFYTSLLSADNTISCASCHDLRTGGVDRRTVSEGIYHRLGQRNAPTVFNSGLNYRQFWDGHAATLEDQVNGPLQGEAEMGSTWEAVITKLRQDAHYAVEFDRLYADGVTPSTVQDALATFERSLVTPNCRFDRYLRGETGALNSTELAGYRLFKSLGCVSCHQGRNVGGGMMQPFGVLQSPYPLAKKAGRDETSARQPSSETLFKVPSLRNVARTAPYFHDGSADSLPKAVRIMSDAQLCRHLSDDEVRRIVAFLQSLTGTYEGRPL